MFSYCFLQIVLLKYGVEVKTYQLMSKLMWILTFCPWYHT
ncbi:hypothetical protein GPK60_04225 [Ruminococcus sp. MCC718]|nr:hypothetical protein [Ruminococcus sp. MCC718]